MKNPQKHSTKIRTTIWTDACAKTKMSLWSVILWPLSTVTKHFNRNNHVPGGIVFMVCYVVSTFDESELRSNEEPMNQIRTTRLTDACAKTKMSLWSVILWPLSTTKHFNRNNHIPSFWQAKMINSQNIRYLRPEGILFIARYVVTTFYHSE